MQLIGDVRQRSEQRDLSRQQAYRRWVETARLYGLALRGSVSARPEGPPIDASTVRVLTIRIDPLDQAGLDDALQAAYHALQPSDMLIVDAPNPIVGQKVQEIQRDLINRALFKAGFDCPMIWAGRKILEAENQSSIVNRLLPSSALGGGPRIVPGVSAPLTVRPEQAIAIARRGDLVPPGERPLRLSVVMPVYNEKETFREVIDAVLAKTIPGVEIEICMVESNSTDGTRDDVLRYAHHPRIRLLLEDKPSGKGRAVRKGLELATGDIVLIQDADLEYDLDDYERLLDPIRRLEASFVLGSRHGAGNNGWQIRHFSEQRGISDVMNLGHLFFTWFLNTIFRQRLRDPFTMYKVFRRDCLHNVRLECNRFDFDHELVGKLIRMGFSPGEINVRYQSRSFDDGKKVAFFRDPPTWIMACLKHRFSDLYIWPASE